MAQKKQHTKKTGTPKKTLAAGKTHKAVRMSRAEMKIYKEMLLKQRSALASEMNVITKDTLKKSQKDASGDLSGYTFHMADLASDHYDREFSLGLASTEQKQLFAIDEALRRIRDGTYGLCVDCGKRIVKKRLQAIPHTDLCIDCQKQQEKDT